MTGPAGDIVVVFLSSNFGESVMIWRQIVWIGAALIFATGCSDANNDSRVRVAQAQLQTLTEALKSYHVLKGDYPDDLQALADSSDGFPARVSKSSLVHPWGRPFHYEPLTRHPTQGTPLIYSDGPTPGDSSERIRNWTSQGEDPAGPPLPLLSEPELKIAQPIAEEFLGHTMRKNTSAALAMSTPAFQKRWGIEPGSGDRNSKDSELRAKISAKYVSWQISSSTLSSGRDEAVFTGRLVAPLGGQSNFTLRLMKEKTGGQWKVDGLNVH
jgi:hypothetical protein